jgi:hypothetical protein
MATFRTHLELGVDGREVPVEVSYAYHRPHRGATDGRHGPPIEPDDPGGIEIDGCTLAEDGREVELTTAQEESIELDIGEWLSQMEKDCDYPVIEIKPGADVPHPDGIGR